MSCKHPGLVGTGLGPGAVCGLCGWRDDGGGHREELIAPKPAVCVVCGGDRSAMTVCTACDRATTYKSGSGGSRLTEDETRAIVAMDDYYANSDADHPRFDVPADHENAWYGLVAEARARLGK